MHTTTLTSSQHQRITTLIPTLTLFRPVMLIVRVKRMILLKMVVAMPRLIGSVSLPVYKMKLTMLKSVKSLKQCKTLSIPSLRLMLMKYPHKLLLLSILKMKM